MNRPQKLDRSTYLPSDSEPRIRLGRAGAYLLLLALPAAVAQGPAEDARSEGTLELKNVVVTDTRSEQSTVTVPASISIISRRDIEASGAIHVVDVLRGHGAIQVADAFGDGSRAQVGMRGFGETAHANTLVLVDGRRLNNGDIGPPDLNSIALKDVERIEIIQGSAGTLFGDQAVGGVINVITRTPQPFNARVAASGGSYSRRSVRGGVADRFETGFSYRISGELLSTDNYRDHNHKNYQNFLGRAGFRHRRGSLFFEYQLVDERLQLPGGLTPAQVAVDRRQVGAFFVNDRLGTDTEVARLGARHQVTDNWSFEAEYANRTTDADGTFFSAPFNSKRRQRDLTPRLIGVYPLPAGEAIITLGADLEHADFDLSAPTGAGTARNRQESYGVYGQAVVPVLPRLSITVGARKAWVENDLTTVSAFGLPDFPAGVELDDSVFVAEVGLAFRPSDRWRLFARRDENFRFAKADEQSFTVPGTVGLGTQEGTSWELGAEWRAGRYEAKLILYRLDQDGEIAFDPTIVGPSPFLPGANVNLDSTERRGVIVAGAVQATARARLSGDYTFTDAEFDSGGLDGNDIPFVARHVARIAVDYRITGQWNVFGEIQGISRRFLIGDNLNIFDELPGYAVVNLHTRFRHRGWTVTGRVNNVADKEYIDSGSPFSLLPSPERNYWATLEYAFR